MECYTALRRETPLSANHGMHQRTLGKVESQMQEAGFYTGAHRGGVCKQQLHEAQTWVAIAWNCGSTKETACEPQAGNRVGKAQGSAVWCTACSRPWQRAALVLSILKEREEHKELLVLFHNPHHVDFFLQVPGTKWDDGRWEVNGASRGRQHCFVGEESGLGPRSQSQSYGESNGQLRNATRASEPWSCRWNGELHLKLSGGNRTQAPLNTATFPSSVPLFVIRTTIPLSPR